MAFIDQTLTSLVATAPALTSLIGLSPMRWYPDTIGTATRPAIAYQRIDNPRVRSLRGDSGLGRARFQLTVFAKTSKQREEMIAALRATLDRYADRNAGGIIDRILYDDARNQFDALTSDYLSFVDFIIWHIET